MTNYAVMSDFNTGLFISNQWAAVRTQADTGTICDYYRGPRHNSK